MASDRPTGGTHGWLKSAVGRATGSELRTRVRPDHCAPQLVYPVLIARFRPDIGRLLLAGFIFCGSQACGRRKLAFHADDLLEPMDDLYEVALCLHHSVDVLIGSGSLVENPHVLAALDPGCRRGVIV